MVAKISTVPIGQPSVSLCAERAMIFWTLTYHLLDIVSERIGGGMEKWIESLQTEVPGVESLA